MPSNFDDQLLREGIQYFQDKQYEAARRYLERAADVSDDLRTQELANFYLSKLTDDPVEKRKYLDTTLAINPANSDAHRALAILDGKLKAEDIVDPNRLPAQSREAQKTGASRFACPKCGSRMIFDGDGSTLICESCTRQEAIQAKSQHNEQDFIIAMATGQGQRAPVSVKTFLCQGCGAEVLLPPGLISESCSYCASVYVAAPARELVEPDSIIPIAFNQREAAMRLVQWVEKHKIKPQGKVHAPRALYLPVWTFDIMGHVPWSGTVYEDNYNIAFGYQGKREVPISGQKIASFDDILVYASSKLADMLPKIIKDFSLDNGAVYDPRYLAGWPAEIYQKALAEASLDARKQAVEQVRTSLHQEQPSVMNLRYSTGNLSIVSFKLVLIPVWITQYKLGDHPYRVIINGQTGSIYGERESQGIAGWLGNLLAG